MLDLLCVSFVLRLLYLVLARSKSVNFPPDKHVSPLKLVPQNVHCITAVPHRDSAVVGVSTVVGIQPSPAKLKPFRYDPVMDLTCVPASPGGPGQKKELP